MGIMALVHYVSGLGLAGGWVPSRGALCGVVLSVSVHRAVSLHTLSRSLTLSLTLYSSCSLSLIDLIP